MTLFGFLMALFAFIGAVVTNATGVIFGTRIADPVAFRLTREGGEQLVVHFPLNEEPGAR